MNLKKLEIQDEAKVKKMNQKISASLVHKDHFIPFTDKEITELLGNGKGALYGVFEAGNLAAVSGLLFDLAVFQTELEMLEIDLNLVAELGGCMTDVTFRSKGYMYKLNVELIKLAKQQNLQYVLATAHPDNIASNKSLQNLGMQFVKEVSRLNKRRNFYILEL